MASFPAITAHTGCDGSQPNTIASAILGLDLGADIVEVDVRTTADGRLVLAHDDSVPVTAGLSLRVSESSLETLESARQAGRVPTLGELFDAVLEREGRVNLDLKDDRSVPLVIELVRRRRIGSRVLLTGCGSDRARAALLRDPGFPVYLNTDFGCTAAEMPSPARIEAECDLARRIGCCGVNVEHRFCTRSLVRRAGDRALTVSVWTVAPGDGFEHFVDLGVANITTRSVASLARLREALR